MVFVLFVCLCLLLHKLASDMPGKNWAPTVISAGSCLALKVEFSLPSSCYATMALRELLKSDTSAAHQATLNVNTSLGKISQSCGETQKDTVPVEENTQTRIETTQEEKDKPVTTGESPSNAMEDT